MWVGGCRGGGGGQNFFAYSGCCVWIWTQVQGNFFLFLYMDPLIHGEGPGSELRVPPVAPPIWAVASEDLAVFMLDKAV